MGFGVAAAGRLLYENVRETDVWRGAIASAVQLALLFPVVIYTIPILAITLLFSSSRLTEVPPSDASIPK